MSVIVLFYKPRLNPNTKNNSISRSSRFQRKNFGPDQVSSNQERNFAVDPPLFKPVFRAKRLEIKKTDKTLSSYINMKFAYQFKLIS